MMLPKGPDASLAQDRPRRREEEGICDGERVSPGYRASSREQKAAGWAGGLILFASMMMFLAGVFQGFTGLAAIFSDQFQASGRENPFQLSLTA